MANTAIGTSAAITPTLSAVNGHAVALSTDVAAHFGKQHNNVLRDIDALLQELPADRLLNFEQTLTERPNPAGGAPIPSRAYRLTRDGFTLLAMGFTGKKALAFKLAYLDAFNRMEAELAGRAQATPPALPNHTHADLLGKAELSMAVAHNVQQAMFAQLLHQQPTWGHTVPPELRPLLQRKVAEMAAQAVPHMAQWVWTKVSWGYNTANPDDVQRLLALVPALLLHHDFDTWLSEGRSTTARNLLALFDTMRDMAAENAAALRGMTGVKA